MRKKIKYQKELDFNPPTFVKKSKIYQIFDRILRENPQIADLVYADLTRGLKNPKTGCEGLSAEQVIRILIVKQVEQLSYRELPMEISDSITLRRFCEFNDGEVPCYSSMCQIIKKLSPQTLKLINQNIVQYALGKGIENGKALRLDSTAVKSNIHYPTDSSLIVDCVEKATSLANIAASMVFGGEYYFPNRIRAVKRLLYKVNNTKKAEHKRKKLLKKLIAYGREVKLNTQKLAEVLKEERPKNKAQKLAIEALFGQIEGFIGYFENVLLQAEERIIKELKVSAENKVLSIFEPHTDIIEKGEREPVFGHKISLIGGKSNLIFDCIIHRGNPSDRQIFKTAIDRHLEIYRSIPSKIAADAGFYSKANVEYAKSMGIKDVVLDRGFGKLISYVKSSWVYKKLKRFRAGIEATISWAKRCFGLDRCTWKGWNSFQSYVWSSIIAFNFTVIAYHLI